MNTVKVTFKFLSPFIVGLLMLLFGSDVLACTSPSGSIGDIRYDGGQFKVCINNNTWRTISGTLVGGSCSNGTLQYVSGQMRMCRGGTWYHVTVNVVNQPGLSNGVSAGGCAAGTFYYESGTPNGGGYVYCNGTSAYEFW